MAQLDNAADSDSEERGFKSLRAGQKKKPVIPYVSRDCRLFSTDEGVNDFLNWLKEDSGYSKAEKKSVLQRIIEFLDRIVEAVKQTIKDGDLSQTAREFAQMQADKAAQIREMFLDALDGIDGKARKNTAEETKNSKKKQRKYTNPYENWYGVDSDGHFLPSNEIGGSDASEQALFWVARENVSDGDLWLAPGLGSCYIIERMEGDRHGYKVVEKIEERDRDYEKRRIDKHNREKRTDLEGRLAGYNNNNKSGANAVGNERHDSDVPEAGHQTESRQIRSVAGTSFNQRKTQIESGQNTFGGNENRTGTGTERLTDSEVKNSLKQTDRDKAESTQNKKRLYNESDTLFLQWSNSPSVPARDRKVFKRGKEWALFEKTEDGCVEMYRGKYKKEVMYYGQTYAETNKSYDGYIEEIGADNGRDLRDLFGIGDEKNADGFGGQTESEKFQSDSEGDNEHLRSGNRGTSDVTDSEIKNSLKQTERDKAESTQNKKDYTMSQTLFSFSGQTVHRFRPENARCLSAETTGLGLKRQRTVV